MIYISDIKNNIYISLDGQINEELNKRGYNEITSTRGVCFQEHIRGVININIDVNYIDEKNYNKLKLMFLTSNSELYIEDDDTGSVYNKYIIKGDTLSFSKNQDVENKKYYYKGNLLLNKK